MGVQFGILFPAPPSCGKDSAGSTAGFMVSLDSAIAFSYSMDIAVHAASGQVFRILNFYFGLVSGSRQFFPILPLSLLHAAWQWLLANHFCRQGNDILIAEQVVGVQFDF